MEVRVASPTDANLIELTVEDPSAATVGDVIEHCRRESDLRDEPGQSLSLLTDDGRRLDLSDSLAACGISEGATLLLLAEANGAGPAEMAAVIGAVAAGGKIAVDAARVTVDAYRAKTERMQAELDRERFEAERHEQQHGSN